MFLIQEHSTEKIPTGQWRVWVYPQGHERAGKLSVFLHGKKANRPARVVYHLGLLRPSGGAPVSRRSLGAHFGEPAQCGSPTASLTWGVRSMADLAEITSADSPLLHAGALTVFAVIESVEAYGADSEPVPGPTSPPPPASAEGKDGPASRERRISDLSPELD